MFSPRAGDRDRSASSVVPSTPPEGDCAFCDNVLSGREGTRLRDHGGVVAFEDRFYPSTPGHVLIIPRRHAERLADLELSEWIDLFLAARFEMNHFPKWWGGKPSGFTIGVNDGGSAGQTVPHVHLHVIPRTYGDTPNPRGGIRWAVPETAAYWEASQ